MGLNSDLVVGQTPLDEEALNGLLIPTITLSKELDQFERLNIEKAIQWTLHGRLKKEDILTEAFVKRLHEKMYGDVWSWAGKFRKTNTNIGVNWHIIPIELRQLLDDCSWWVSHGTYPPDELAVRLKHRLVSIHCFPNGNGRHSRLMADLLAEKVLGRPVFSWGNGDNRQLYIQGVKAADLGNIETLLSFARS
ncbi:MAG TPA: mobile mystery protein B [Cyclobacteriaceae bacterium]|nr:mobile mystery protein B [Cyclobacteriaceae bacterium]